VVPQVLQVHRVSKVPWEKEAIQGHQDHLDLLVLGDFQVCLAKMV